ALQFTQSFFGKIAARKVPGYEPGSLKAQTSEHRETISDPNASLQGMHIAYHIPASREKDHYALEILGNALSDGESSLLYRKLVKDKELCVEVHADADGRRGPDLFSFWLLMASAKQPADAETVINALIQEIGQKGLSERDLQKAKNRIQS